MILGIVLLVLGLLIMGVAGTGFKVADDTCDDIVGIMSCFAAMIGLVPFFTGFCIVFNIQ